jgi:hypothetical protein
MNNESDAALDGALRLPEWEERRSEPDRNPIARMFGAGTVGRGRVGRSTGGWALRRKRADKTEAPGMDCASDATAISVR